MKNKFILGLLLIPALLFVACGDDDGADETPEEVSAIVGTWVLAEDAGLAVGPASGDGSWWTAGTDIAAGRACLYDDTYEFTADGNLIISMGSETWLESWQGTDPEACGAPVAPHTSGTYTYEYDESTTELVLSGAGAFIGLPKATNAGELSTGATQPSSRTYTVFSINETSAQIRINTGVNSNGDEVHWTFRLTKQ